MLIELAAFGLVAVGGVGLAALRARRAVLAKGADRAEAPAAQRTEGLAPGDVLVLAGGPDLWLRGRLAFVDDVRRFALLRAEGHAPAEYVFEGREGRFLFARAHVPDGPLADVVRHDGTLHRLVARGEARVEASGVSLPPVDAVVRYAIYDAASGARVVVVDLDAAHRLALAGPRLEEGRFDVLPGSAATQAEMPWSSSK